MDDNNNNVVTVMGYSHPPGYDRKGGVFERVVGGQELCDGANVTSWFRTGSW